MSKVISPTRGSVSEELSEGLYEVRAHAGQEWETVTIQSDDNGLFFKKGNGLVLDSDFHLWEFRELNGNE